MSNWSGALFLDLNNHLLESKGYTARVEQKLTWFPPCHKFIVKDGDEVLFESYCPVKAQTYIHGYVKGQKSVAEPTIGFMRGRK